MSKPSTIAVDGPAASGKTTLGKALARELGYLYFDTGVMYRAATLCALERGRDVRDKAAVTEIAEGLVIDVVPPTEDDGRPYTVYADGDDVTWCIRSRDVDANVSLVSTYPGVRAALTRQQRRVGERGQVVMTGRDIGTVVLPDADLKFYLDATVEERAHRRWREAQSNGRADSYEDILSAMRRRDQIDSQRDIAPLRPASDAVIIDTTDKDAAVVLANVLKIVEAYRVEEGSEE